MLRNEGSTVQRIDTEIHQARETKMKKAESQKKTLAQLECTDKRKHAKETTRKRPNKQSPVMFTCD